MQNKVVTSSSAFPAHVQPPSLSESHKLIQSATQVSAPRFRDFEQPDLAELRQLHQQWFPVAYQNPFYNNIIKKRVRTIVAVVTLTFKDTNENGVCKESTKDVVVGAIVFQFQPVEWDVLAKESWSDYFYSDRKGLYILTLGVIDEYRSKGIASRLLESCINEAKAEENCKYVSLHVVAYNSAKEFYQKKGFQLMQVLDDYYNLFGQDYGGLLYAFFVNGGKPKKGWIQWAKGFWRGNR